MEACSRRTRRSWRPRVSRSSGLSAGSRPSFSRALTSATRQRLRQSSRARRARYPPSREKTSSRSASAAATSSAILSRRRRSSSSLVSFMDSRCTGATLSTPLSSASLRETSYSDPTVTVRPQARTASCQISPEASASRRGEGSVRIRVRISRFMARRARSSTANSAGSEIPPAASRKRRRNRPLRVAGARDRSRAGWSKN